MSNVQTPELRVVEKHFEQFYQSEYPDLVVSEAFEYYVATQVLKPHDLSADQLAAGNVDGSHDGGIDSVYVFLNGALVSSDDPVLESGSLAAARVGSKPTIDVHVIQSKKQTSWQESAWEHLTASLTELLDWDKADAELEVHFNPDVVEQIGVARKLIDAIGVKFPKIIFQVHYVTLALESHVSDTLHLRSAQVMEVIESRLPKGAQISAHHVGVQSLYAFAGRLQGEPGVLKFRTLIREAGSYLGVVEVANYLDFVRDQRGDLRDELFESNVRDYEGDNSVNEAIGDTLASSDGPEFWWLNNGVTVLGTEVAGPQSTLTVANPLIVNGLQTTHVLHQSQKNGRLHESRVDDGLVVRVIESADEDTRDRVISGTNRQTRVPTPALYATRPIHRDLERFLEISDWCYERRKNRYKNLGKPAARRISMGLMGQAMITVLEGHPDIARARPSTALSDQKRHDDLFNDTIPKEAYQRAIELLKGVDEVLRGTEAESVLKDFANTRFYVLAGYVLLERRTKAFASVNFASTFSQLTIPVKASRVILALRILRDVLRLTEAEDPDASRDKIFKNAEFRDRYFAAIATRK